MSLSPGQVISCYRVVGSLGAGGMGEVYRARDTRLERDVALKVLPDGWDDDADHAKRFEREARTLASLNHGNVAQVYGFDHIDGVRFLVLELVEGEDLATRIERGPLKPRDAVAVCRQIAEGLEAAHEHGVVHRDLKPANVRITPDGVAKVLDFGLAKSVRTAAEDDASPRPDSSFRTQIGVLVGTPTYMSPERVRGQPEDRRGDIWAFGCVLYECLTGKAAFAGSSLPDTLAAIVEREPDPTLLPPATPERVRALLERCLDKDPRTRLRDIGEARVALSGTDPDAVPLSPGARGPSAARSAIVVAALLAIGVTVGALIPHAPSTAEFAPPADPPNPIAGARISKLTDTEWTEFDANISRDGKFVAFASDRDGRFDVWLRQLGTWEDVNLTQGSKPTWGLKVRDLGFNLDGTRVWTTGYEDEQSRSISLFGKELRNHFRDKVINTDWSPDGSRVVYHMSDEGDPLYVAGPNDENYERILIHTPGLHQHYPVWSFDGDWIYFVRGRPTTLEMDLWRVRPDKSASGLEQMTFDLRDVSYPTPVDADTVLFLAREPNGAGPWFYAVDVKSKRSARVAWGVEQYTSLAASKDGRTIVATVANPSAGLWSVALPAEGEAPMTESGVERYEHVETLRGLCPRFGKESLYFLSSRGAGDGLWRWQEGRTEEVLPGEDYALTESPAVSRDGSMVAFVRRTEGRIGVWTATADGLSAKSVCDTIEVVGSPTWSPDGQWIAIGGKDAGASGLFRIPAAGGTPERLTTGLCINPVWSPSEDLIVYAGPSVMAFHTVLGVRPSDKSEVKLPEMKVIRIGERFRFLPDGSGLVYMQGVGTRQDFWLLDLATLSKRRLTQFGDAAIMRTFDIDPTGKRIVFDRTKANSDVVLIERR